MKNIGTISLVVAGIIIAGMLLFSKTDNNSNVNNSQVASNVSIVEGKQIITINVRGGYFPKITTAKANIPTAIKFKSQNAFDCSSAISIPELGYQKNLPPTGETLLEIPVQKSGTILRGTCSMGMYNFSINFE